MATLARVKLRSRKRLSGISGSGARVCQARNRASTAIPPPMSPHATGPQAKAWPSWIPNTSRNIPTALSATPIGSKRRTAVDSAGTRRAASTNPTTPTGTLTKKIHCQPKPSTSRPPTIGPTSTATPAPAPQGGDGEDGEADQVHALGAEAVAEPSGDQQRHRVGEQVGAGDPDDGVD